jgi:hypothetical protein
MFMIDRYVYCEEGYRCKLFLLPIRNNDDVRRTPSLRYLLLTFYYPLSYLIYAYSLGEFAFYIMLLLYYSLKVARPEAKDVYEMTR